MGPERFMVICGHSSVVYFLVLCGNYTHIQGLVFLRCLYRGRKYHDFKWYGLPNYSSEIWSDRRNNSGWQPLVRA